MSSPQASPLSEPQASDPGIARLLHAFFLLRAVILIGSLGSFLGALLMFVAGFLHLGEAAHSLGAVPGDAVRRVTVDVLEAVDAFLFGIVLVIFSFGVAVGFVFQVPPRLLEKLPRWIRIESVGHLKQILTEVVLVVLIVIFARLVVEQDGVFAWTMLVLPVAIFLIALAVKVLDFEHRSNEKGAEQ
jgi:uncharacterized membrane protein YqhA